MLYYAKLFMHWRLECIVIYSNSKKKYEIFKLNILVLLIKVIS